MNPRAAIGASATNEFTFAIAGAEPALFAAVPTMMFDLRVDDAIARKIHSIALTCQIRIEPNRRDHTLDEGDTIHELFGDSSRWGTTMTPFVWTHVTTMIPSFEKATSIKMPVPCSYELEAAAPKYLHSLGGGEIPLLFLFSGTIFAESESGGLAVSRVPWSCESRFRLPVRAWREMMDAYYPNAGWLRLPRETLDALLAFKARRALPTWEGVMQALLAESRGAHTKEAS